MLNTINCLRKEKEREWHEGKVITGNGQFLQEDIQHNPLYLQDKED